MGGSTFDPRTGENLSGKNLWAVGAVPEGNHYSDHPPTQEEYDQFAQRHAGLLQHPNSAVGSYHDKETGLHSIEVVAVTPNRHAAEGTARSLGENHIYHLGSGQKMPINPDGERPVVPESPNRRFEDLRASEPAKQPFFGVHYSDAKTDVIDGNRRGLGGHAEAARLRMGSQTGHGKDAPPGFYAYGNDALPEPQHAMKKNAHPIKGNFAFADTEHPVFTEAREAGRQAAEERGADPETAKMLGINAGEHALRDAGYDGYYSSKHPGTFFLFGSYGITK